MSHKQKTSILDVVPAFWDDVEIKPGNEGGCTLSFPRLRVRLLARWTKKTYLELDATGAAVAELIDGVSDVAGIIQKMAAHFDYKDNYAERIILFISELQAQGAVKFLAKT